MRIIIGVLLLAATVGAQPPSATASPGARMQPASTMSELMVKIIYPASDAIFYITTREPKTEAEWVELQGKALAVAESANLLMMPGRARDQDRWMQDAQADARRRPRGLPRREGEGRRRARRAQRSALHVVHQLSPALPPELRPASGAGSRRLRPSLPLRPLLPLPPLLPRPPRRGPPSKAAGSCARPKTCAPTARSRACPGASTRSARSSSSAARCYVQIMSSDTPSFAPARRRRPSR